jgi:hypothetical protein
MAPHASPSDASCYYRAQGNDGCDLSRAWRRVVAVLRCRRVGRWSSHPPLTPAFGAEWMGGAHGAGTGRCGCGADVDPVRTPRHRRRRHATRPGRCEPYPGARPQQLGAAGGAGGAGGGACAEAVPGAGAIPLSPSSASPQPYLSSRVNNTPSWVFRGTARPCLTPRAAARQLHSPLTLSASFSGASARAGQPRGVRPGQRTVACQLPPAARPPPSPTQRGA